MAVVSALVPLTANDWTLVASAVPKVLSISSRNPNSQLFLIPTATNTKPAALDLTTQACVPFTGQANSVANDDGGTYWSANAGSVVVWKV